MATTDTSPLDASQVERLVAFVYLLMRGTPSFAGVSWGEVKGIVRELAEIEGEHSFCSPAGEALAREVVLELLTGERHNALKCHCGGALVDINRIGARAVLKNADGTVWTQCSLCESEITVPAERRWELQAP